MRTRALALLVVCGLWSCSGGGGTQSLPAAAPTPSTSGAPSAPTGPAAVATSTKFTITVPAPSATSSRTSRTPKFVSPSTQSIVITLVSVNGTSYTGSPASIATNLSTSNPACTGTTSLTCTVTAPAVAGTDLYSVVTYDTPQTVPFTTATGNVLSRANVTIAITAGTNNTATTPLILSGVVNAIKINLATNAVAAGTSATIPVTVAAFDADNNQIIGSANYVGADGAPLTITLTDSDTSGLTSLSTTSVTGPATAVTLQYTGGLPSTATLNASIGATASGGTLAGSVTPSAFAVNIPTPTFTNLSAAEWVTGSAASSFTETLSGTNFVNGTSVSAGTGVTVSAIHVTSSTSLTATFTVAANTAPNTQSITVNNGPVSSGLLPFKIVTGSIVTLQTDTASVGTSSIGVSGVNGTGPGAAGDLRFAMNNANPGDTIVFNCAGNSSTPCTITLAGPLPPIEQNLTIDGGTFGDVVIAAGNGTTTGFRAFFVDTGTVTLENLAIENALAMGGNGGDGNGGGGGLGAGAGLFVNQSTAIVTVANVLFQNCSVVGGQGGSGISDASGGGGGGLDMAGGSAATDAGGGAGGGGVLAAGAAATSTTSRGGGGGGAELGAAAGGTSTSGALGSIGYGSNPAGSAGVAQGSAGLGGSGGFGGGGGGGGNGGDGGNGGFGGGGGASTSDGGNGGFGAGGGGGGAAGNGGGGGSFGGTGGFDQVEHAGAGGGGAALGPAIFVNAGTLTTVNSGATNTGTPATAGTGGEAGATNGTADQTPVFNVSGTVNGATGTTPGGVASALGSTAPQSTAHHPVVPAQASRKAGSVR